ncbi:immunoglobulin domain-containing protein [Ditylenchus destructor]|uniref:Immunoglobulin domain-containing protein n=1 Tax=Ditylenchus destructor TaxID=166010 RepID=A0AAD4NEL4_9BILA|nr:immunoglobulin domain-containing protein [Ditylenchus destructor]
MLMVVLISFILLAQKAMTKDLLIEPAGIGGDKSIYIVKTSLKFIVACSYSDDDVRDEHSLQWLNEASLPIEPSISILTQAKRKNNRIKRSLIFVKIQKHDAGEYKCRAELSSGDFITKSIHIIVLSNIEWNTPFNKVGGVLGDSLTIDCGARGDPLPIIEITNEIGQEVDSVLYKETNSEVTIQQLTKRHQAVKFRCVAVQTINVNNEFNTTTADVHEIEIDVWYPPEFEYKEVERYAIPNKNITLLCVVTDSNPPAEKFSFYKSNEIIYNHERYEVTTLVDSQTALLRIDSVEEDDYGRYKCVANNGKLRTEQIIILKKTAPPKQPRVEVVDVTNSSVMLRITETREEGDLPVLSYSILYIPANIIGDDTQKIVEQRERRANERRSVIRQRNELDLYDLRGLETHVNYEILIYPKSEAGQGDPTLINVMTGTGEVSMSARSIVHLRMNDLLNFYLCLYISGCIFMLRFHL